MIIGVASGKGGTGKTTVAVNLAVSIGSGVQLLDCDVEEPNAHLFMLPIMDQTLTVTTPVPEIDEKKCTRCGLCRDLCRWNAIGEDYRVDPIECEGCGVCAHLCPEKAIDFPEKTCGEWYMSRTRFGPMVHARLGVAEENSGKLVTLVRQEARRLAERDSLGLILTDGPPGAGCPVIASLGGADAALIVTEPTVSGKHDMDRVAQLAQFFRVPVTVCVNKSDLNPEFTRDIQRYTEEKGFGFAGTIPFDPTFIHAMVQGQTVLEFDRQSKAAAGRSAGYGSDSWTLSPESSQKPAASKPDQARQKGDVMKIHLSVKGLTSLYKLFGKKTDIDLAVPGNTLQDVVNELLRKYGSAVKKAILDDTGEIDMELRVSVNLMGFLTYGERMNTPLNDGDKLYIMVGG